MARSTTPSADGLTPMMQQFFEAKRQHPDALVFFRMGDFFEMFYDDAVVASGELGITLTSRGKGPGGESAPMCGVPAHSYEGYLARLVDAGHKVAVCDQVEDPRKARGLVKRDVVRVVTPGTFTAAEADLSTKRHILACLAELSGGVGLALAELATGRVELLEASENLEAWLRDELARSAPQEILTAEGSELVQRAGCVNGASLTQRPGWWFEPAAAVERLKQHLGSPLKAYDLEGRSAACTAAGALLCYLEETQKTSLDHIRDLRVLHPEDLVHIDATTARNLEICASLADGSTRHTLVGTVDRSMTPMGARQLRDWLMRPARRPEVVLARHQAVQTLVDEPGLLEPLREELSGVRDVERLLARVSLGTANARDLVGLGVSLARVPRVRGLLGDTDSELLEECFQQLDPLDDVTSLLERALASDPPTGLRDGGLIREGYHNERDELYRLAHHGKTSLAALETREREATGISSLKVKFNKVFGYFIEVSRANLALVPERYERRQTLANAERFVTPELKQWEAKVLSAEERLLELEYELFTVLRGQVAAEGQRIGRTARALAVMDALSSFAHTAVELRWSRPKLSEDGEIRIREGRHPVVEAALERDRFVPNDTYLDDEQRSILIITGPNMGGKSTYLRQVALITLLAHAGSFVPAAEAKLGLVDRIFARVGASDDLARGASTFMVEMVETANILHAHTSRSLVLLDEVGRGTSTFDGLSLAWAIVEHLHGSDRGCPKVLFATHYHELTDLAELLPKVHNLRLAVREWRDEIVFLRRIEEGRSDRSYGIHVARLAGVPEAIILRAREVLSNLESVEIDLMGSSRLARRQEAPRQLSLFGEPTHPVLDEIRNLDPDLISPLDALKLLVELRRRLGES